MHILQMGTLRFKEIKKLVHDLRVNKWESYSLNHVGKILKCIFLTSVL